MGLCRDRFDHVVNALWDGRLGLNEALGFRANRPWLHRLKYGVSFRLPGDVRPPPSVTFVLGPFGEVVTYGDGFIYLTWYPECLQAMSHGCDASRLGHISARAPSLSHTHRNLSRSVSYRAFASRSRCGTPSRGLRQRWRDRGMGQNRYLRPRKRIASSIRDRRHDRRPLPLRRPRKAHHGAILCGNLRGAN